MTSGARLLIEKLALTPKRLFLIDGLGAFCTAFFLAAILATFEQFFGMPRKVLYPLALVVCGYGIYSCCCYFFVRGTWRSYLKLIMMANFLYCLASIALVVYFYHRLTILGLAYFFIELIVLAGLLLIEQRVLAAPQPYSSNAG
jgi:hypothetical protein